MDTVFLYLVLDSVAEAVEYLCVSKNASLDVLIGAGKVIAFGICRIGVKIGEDVIHVDGMLHSEAVIERRIVGARVGNARALEFIQIVVEGMKRSVLYVCHRNNRTVVCGVHGLHLAIGRVKIDLHK